MKTIFDLAKISTEQLCEMFNDMDNVMEEKDISSSDIINEFINRKNINCKYSKGCRKYGWK